MDEDELDDVTVAQLPSAESDEPELAGDLPPELLFELLMC